MSDLASYLDSGAWADPNPTDCPCRDGWFLSNYDTWHRCPFHGAGAPHPEDEVGESDDAATARRRSMLRACWTRAREQSGMAPIEFLAAVERIVPAGPRPSWGEWVWLAFKVADEAEETRIHGEGFLRPDLAFETHTDSWYW